MAEIDPLSVVSLHLEPMVGGKKAGDATGFGVLRKGSPYLITNWHVVTMRHPDTNQPLDQKTARADPDELAIWFHVKDQLGNWRQGTYPVLAASGSPLWLEHPAGRKVDVVAVPLDLPPEVHLYPLDLESAKFDLIISPSEPVSIIGFPLGLSSSGKLPIWKTGHVASDMDLDYTNRPMFLIDATTKPAMSGSPVIAVRIGLYRSSTGFVMGTNATRFLGVYSGRIHEDIDANIGFVWKPRVIEEIFAHAGI